MKAHVLLLDAYARQTLPMIRGFKAIDCEVTVVCYSKLDVGYASRYPDHRILLPCEKEDHAAQYQLVKKLIESKKYSIVVPMNDYAAIYLSQNKAYLSRYAFIAVNDESSFRYAINKVNTMRLCDEHGIPSPKTYFANHPEEVLNDDSIAYPVVVKPQTACGSIGFNIATDKNHLKSILGQQDTANGPVFIQEYIPQNGPQYGAEAYRNADGSYSFLLIDEKPRWFPLDGGSPTINVTVHNEEMASMAKKLLDAMNWIGYANIDFVVDCRTNQPKILEVNGRISAAVSIDEIVGYNVPQLIYQTASNAEMTKYGDYRDNMKVSCILTEFLWFLKSSTRFRNKPSMFNRRNTKDVIFRINDPKPFFTFCLQSVKNYRGAMKRRARI